MGEILSRALLHQGKEFRSSGERGRVALVLAGDHAVIATVPTGKDSNVRLRPLATIQIADLKTGAVLSSFETKLGVIENGMAVAQGRCFVVLDDGSVAALE